MLNGKKVEVRTPVDAKKLGIQIVYQEVDMALYPTLSVAENIVQNDMVMGKSGYIVNWKKAYKQGQMCIRDRGYTAHGSCYYIVFLYQADRTACMDRMQEPYG